MPQNERGCHGTRHSSFPRQWLFLRSRRGKGGRKVIMSCRAWRELPGIVVRRFVVEAVCIICGIGVVFVVSLLAIECCTWRAFDEERYVALVGYVPLLERLVWPTFLLIVLFLFKRNVNSVLKQVPGLLRRSTLPNSAPVSPLLPAYSEAASLTESDKEGDQEEYRAPKDHPDKVRKVLSLLECEYGVRAVLNVAVGKSPWKADGAFDFFGIRYYVAVLPAGLKKRIPKILFRMKDVLANGEKCVFLLFVYGCDRVDEFIDPDSAARSQIILRAKKFD